MILVGALMASTHLRLPIDYCMRHTKARLRSSAYPQHYFDRCQQGHL
jgi:hypothetical protein